MSTLSPQQAATVPVTVAAEVAAMDDSSLRAILLTVDGRGKGVKELVLDTLIERRP